MTKTRKKWTRKQKLFAEWLATPKKERQPKTQNEFAEHVSISPGTLSRWKAVDEFEEYTYSVARRYLGYKLADILEVVAKKAAEGDLQFIVLALTLCGRYSEELTVNQNVSSIGIESFGPIAERLNEWKKSIRD